MMMYFMSEDTALFVLMEKRTLHLQSYKEKNEVKEGISILLT